MWPNEIIIVFLAILITITISDSDGDEDEKTDNDGKIATKTKTMMMMIIFIGSMQWYHHCFWHHGVPYQSLVPLLQTVNSLQIHRRQHTWRARCHSRPSS